MSDLRYHGMLCLQNCLVGQNWIVKLTNFVTEEIIGWLLTPTTTFLMFITGDKLRHNEIKYLHVKSHRDSKKRQNKKPEKEDTESKHESVSEHEEDAESVAAHVRSASKKFVQLAPEIVREIVTTKHLPRGSQMADIYSLGMVLYQILFKVEPFHERNISSNKILEKLALVDDNDKILRPTFPQQTGSDSDNNYSSQLLLAIEACWSEIPEARPNIKKIKVLINSTLGST